MDAVEDGHLLSKETPAVVAPSRGRRWGLVLVAVLAATAVAALALPRGARTPLANMATRDAFDDKTLDDSAGLDDQTPPKGQDDDTDPPYTLDDPVPDDGI